MKKTFYNVIHNDGTVSIMYWNETNQQFMTFIIADNSEEAKIYNRGLRHMGFQYNIPQSGQRDK